MALRRLAPRALGAAALCAILLGGAPHAHAGLIRGVGRILAGVLEVPRSILVGTFTGPPIVGTLLGVVNGTVNGVMSIAGGALEIAGSAVPLAMKAAPLIPVFL